MTVESPAYEPMVLRLLGQVEVFGDDGGPVRLAPQAARLLALLAATGSPVDKSQIAEHVTGTAADASAVRTAVSRLRSAVGSLVVRTDAGYVLDVAPERSDVGRFRELLRIAEGSTEPMRVSLLRQALELWRGDPFGVFAEEHWALAQAVELRALRSAAVEDLAEALFAVEDHGGAIAVLRPHIVDQPLDERPVGLIMRALAALGKLAEALAEFQRLRVSLDEIGLVPSGDLRRLEHELLRRNDAPAVLPGGSVARPDGRVAIVFTDIVGSTRLWATSASAMSASLEFHDHLVQAVFGTHDGYVFARLGDGVAVAFASCEDAVQACVAAQDALSRADWPGVDLQVRMGVAVGEPEVRDHRYFGDTVNVAARLAAAANGGQIVTSSEIRDEVAFDGLDLGGHHLQGIAAPQHIWQVGFTEHPPLQAPSVVPVHLPLIRHELIGRDRALESVTTMLRDKRLVTLTGAGGSGKTVLAIAVAHGEVPAYPGGVYFVDLAPVEVGTAVIAAFARAMGMPAGTSDIDRLITSLPEGRALLVIDNCEHVLRDAQRIVDRIIDRHAQVHVLATSREALQVDGERIHRVASLDTSLNGPASELFVERGLAARPDADLSNRQAVAELCVQLDGMPLAIEMAAARMRSMTVEEILRRLDDRFRLLSGGTQRARRRQQTLEAVVAWSHDLLEPAEQQFFRRLAVFSGGFFLDAAAAVGDVDEKDAADLLDTLVNKSLIERTTAAGESRFGLLESLRVFAWDRLAETDDPVQARRRHAAHFAGRWDDPQTTTGAHRRHLVDEHNMIAAIDWAREQDDAAETLAKLVSLGGPIGALIERRWSEPGTAQLVREIVAAAESSAVRQIPELQVPFIAAAAIGSFAAFTNDADLRSAVEALDRLASQAVDTMHDDGFSSLNPSCGLLLLHSAHHDLPAGADRTRKWANEFVGSTDYGISATARMVAEISLTFLDPSNPEIDPLRILGDAAPEGPWANAIAANAAYVAIVAGRAAQAASLLDMASSGATPGSMSDLNRVVAHVATALSLGHVADAMTLLTDQLEDVPFGVPGRESTYLALCAWAHHLIGQAARAEHLIDQTVKRLPQDYLLTCHVKSIIDQWPAEAFHDRSVAWHDEHTMAGDVVERIEAMPALLDDEMTYWSSRRVLR